MDEQSTKRSGLTKTETRKSLEYFNWSLGFRGVFDTVCGGTTLVFVAFALSLGLARERMGFITSIVSCACIIQMVSLIATTRVKSKKRFILSVALAEPLLMIAAVLVVPFLPAGMRLYALAVVIFMAAASLNLTKPLTDDWLASTIPAGVRGRYIGRRFQIMSVAVILSTLIAGQVLERIGKTNTTGLACILAAGGVFGILSLLALSRATMPTLAATSHVKWADIPNTLKNRSFRRYVIGVIIYNGPFFISVPYYQVYNLNVLGMRESHIAYMFVAYYLVRILATPFLGRRVDRKGARWTMLLLGPLYVLFFVGLSISSHGVAWPTVAAWAIAGIGDAAYTVAVTSNLYGSIPRTPDRPAYFAMANLLTLATFGVGAALAVPILEALKDVQFSIGPLEFEQFQCLFLICTAMMIPCMFGAKLLADSRRAGNESS